MISNSRIWSARTPRIEGNVTPLFARVGDRDRRRFGADLEVEQVGPGNEPSDTLRNLSRRMACPPTADSTHFVERHERFIILWNGMKGLSFCGTA